MASIASSSRNMSRPQKLQPQRISRSLAGSQLSLADQHSTISMASTASLDHLTDSPKAGGYFKHPPNTDGSRYESPSTMSLDLAVDHRRFSMGSPLLPHHGSAPDLRSPDTSDPPAPMEADAAAAQPNGAVQVVVQEGGASSSSGSIQRPDVGPHPDNNTTAVPSDPLFADDGMDSVSARTEALAVCSTFKLRGRGRLRTSSVQSNA